VAGRIRAYSSPRRVASPLETRTWDWRAALLADRERLRANLHHPPGSGKHRLGKQESGITWPWPREMYSAVVDFVGAKAHGRSPLMCSLRASSGAQDDQVFEPPCRFGEWWEQSFSATRPGATRWPEEWPLPTFHIEGWIPGSALPMLGDCLSRACPSPKWAEVRP
jgi:adenylate cyclase